MFQVCHETLLAAEKEDKEEDKEEDKLGIVLTIFIETKCVLALSVVIYYVD